MFQWILNNLQIVLVGLLFFGPVLANIAKWLKDQAAKKQAEAEQRRRADSQLRTGRAEPSDPTPASASQSTPTAQGRSPAEGQTERPENFAERRRRQIEELKRRQEAAQQRRDTARQTPPQPVPAPVSTPTRRPPQRRRDVTSPTPGPTGTASAAPAVIEQPSAEIQSLAERFQRLTAAEQESAAPVLPIGIGMKPGQKLDRQTLRQAVVLAEVLAPPVGMRDDAQRAV